MPGSHRKVCQVGNSRMTSRVVIGFTTFVSQSLANKASPANLDVKSWGFMALNILEALLSGIWEVQNPS